MGKTLETLAIVFQLIADIWPAPLEIDGLLARLDGVRANGDGCWVARCPAHEDGHPSLSIRETERGAILLHCFAGCSTADILAVLDLTFSQLFSSSSHGRRIPRARGEAREHARMVALVAREDLKAGKTLSRQDRAKVIWAIRTLEGRMRSTQVAVPNLLPTPTRCSSGLPPGS